MKKDTNTINSQVV